MTEAAYKTDTAETPVYLRPEYRTWITMRARCNNPRHGRYEGYGARGIRVCAEWERSFSSFFSHIGPKPTPKHTIERINSSGHYEPGNVRWATTKEQQNNRRNTQFVTYRGERMTLRDAAEKVGVVSRNVARCRIRNGWSVDAALETPYVGKGWRKGKVARP